MKKQKKAKSKNLINLPPFDEQENAYNVITETLKGSRNKYKYNPQHNVFELHGVLPAGATFPFDFGFIPGTRGGDGDPLDVLLLLDEPAYSGVLVRARLVGVIEAEQTEKDGKTERNDRLLAVCNKCSTFKDVKDITDLSDAMLTEVENFFVHYNEQLGKKFIPIGRGGKRKAQRLVERGRQKLISKRSAAAV